MHGISEKNILNIVLNVLKSNQGWVVHNRCDAKKKEIKTNWIK